jgi:hypothetical protein
MRGVRAFGISGVGSGSGGNTAGDEGAMGLVEFERWRIRRMHGYQKRDDHARPNMHEGQNLGRRREDGKRKQIDGRRDEVHAVSCMRSDMNRGREVGLLQEEISSSCFPTSDGVHDRFHPEQLLDVP